MTDRPAKHLEFTTTIVAPIDEVWNALTTGEGLQAWYVAKATVEPGLGGEVAISWGEGPEGLSRIDIWEQPHRVRFAYVPQGGMEVGDQGGGSEEWFLTHDDGVTTVRLVHSLPDPGVEDWQGYYGDIERGWSLFLATLGYYVESTERRGRVTTLATPRVRGEATEVWKRLQAELGLSGPVAGAETALTIDGSSVPAKVLVAAEPLAILLDVDGTLLLADLEGSGEDRVMYTLASTFGNDSATGAARRAALVAAVGRAAG